MDLVSRLDNQKTQITEASVVSELKKQQSEIATEIEQLRQRLKQETELGEKSQTEVQELSADLTRAQARLSKTEVLSFVVQLLTEFKEMRRGLKHEVVEIEVELQHHEQIRRRQKIEFVAKCRSLDSKLMELKSN